MRTLVSLSALAAAVLAISATAGAQASAAAPATAAAPAAASAPAVPWTKSSVGTYDITVQTPDGTEPAKLIIATDTTGALTAKVVEGPRDDEHPLQIEVKGDDLVCQSPTNNGVMTLTFQRHGDRLVGKWAAGGNGGSITGKLRS